MTIQITEVPKQEVMTRDNVSLGLESVLYWRVIAPYEAEYGIANVLVALVERARTVLRNVCGHHTLQDIIENRDAISREIRANITPFTDKWGVEVSVFISSRDDIVLFYHRLKQH